MIRAFALALLLAVPGLGAAQAPLRVVATTADLKALVEAVGGGRVAAESLASPDQDPHGIELKPTQLARVKEAELLVRIGLDHEPWLARAQPGPATRVLDTSRSVRLLQTETPRLRAERRAHVHAFGNPHYWLDPVNAKAMAAAIARALSEARPADRPAFEANRAAFDRRLDERMKAWDAAMASHRGARIVVVHDSWTYFADHFGLRIVAAAEPTPGVPPSPAELATLFERMREAGVKVLVADPHANPALVQQVVARTGARAVVLHPSGFDYLALMDANVAQLARALDGR